MRVSNTADRLKQLMQERNLKQVDLLEAVLPFCRSYGIKMNRSNISQYVNGTVQPSQDKLSMFSLAFGVSEPWLMGYDDDDASDSSAEFASTSQAGHSDIIHISYASGDSSADELRKQLHEFIDSLPDDELRAMSIVFKIPFR